MRTRNYAVLVATLAASGLFLAARGDEPAGSAGSSGPASPTPAGPRAPRAEARHRAPPVSYPSVPPTTAVQPRLVAPSPGSAGRSPTPTRW